MPDGTPRNCASIFMYMHVYMCNMYVYILVGKEVAEYCSRHMPEMLQSNSSYQSGDLQSALKEVFLLADRKLLEKDVIKELKCYVAGVKDNETDIEIDSR